jgi:hypothetical protein
VHAQVDAGLMGQRNAAALVEFSRRSAAAVKVRYCSSSGAIVLSGGGDPPRVSSGIVWSRPAAVGAALRFLGGLCFGGILRLAVGRRFAGVRRLAPVRRLLAVRRLAVLRRFAVARRFNGVRFVRAERDFTARFLRFAMWCPSAWAHTVTKKIFWQRGVPQMRVTGTTLRISLARATLHVTHFETRPLTGKSQTPAASNRRGEIIELLAFLPTRNAAACRQGRTVHQGGQDSY